MDWQVLLSNLVLNGLFPLFCSLFEINLNVSFKQTAKSQKVKLIMPRNSEMKFGM